MQLKWWNNFWFKPAPYINLAIFRIIAVSVTLYFLVTGKPGHIEYLFSLNPSLFDALFTLKASLLAFGIPWGGMPSESLISGIFWVSCISGVLALIGFRTNISLLIFAITSIIIQSFEYSFNDLHHREAAMMVALLALSLAPCGRVLSIDNMMGKGHNPWVDSKMPNVNGMSPYAGWPVLFMLAFFSLMYWSADVSKIAHGGLDWANGWTLQLVMARDSIRHDSPLAVWLSQQHNLLHLAQYVVLVFQATFFLVLFFPKLRWIYFPLGLFFHIFILFTLKAPFYHWIFLYFAFFPWSAIIEYVKLKLNARQNIPATVETNS